MRWNVSIAGLPVGVDVWPAATPILERVLGGCPRLPPDSETVARIVWREPALERPTREPDVRTDDADFWLDGDGVVAAHRSGLAGTVSDSCLVLGGPAGSPEHTRPLRMSIQLPLSQLLSRVGRHVIHAALVRHGDAGVVIVGPSGAGKSTAAYAASTAGWEVLADDMAVVDERGHGWGFPKPLHVPAEVLGGAEGFAEIPGDERERVVLPPPELTSSDGCRIVGVVDVGHADGPARLEEPPAGLAWTQALLSSFPVAAAPWGARQVFVAARSLARLPAVALLHDADPARRVGSAARLLAETVEAWTTATHPGDPRLGAQ